MSRDRKLLIFFGMGLLALAAFVMMRSQEPGKLTSREPLRPSFQSRSEVGRILPSPLKEPVKEAQFKDQKPLVQAMESASKDGLFFEMDRNLAIFNGDIILGEVRDSEAVRFGMAEVDRTNLWSLPIPYATAQNLPSPERVEAAIRYFQEQTPVKFVPFSGHGDGIIFVEAEEHCRSYLGRRGSLQPIFLSPKCGTQEIIHELMHALGFVHEQSRTDRDNYLEILWENIDPKQIRQFQKVPDILMETMNGTDFDFGSVMLYRPSAFAKTHSLPTMRSKTGDSLRPVDHGLSAVDRERLERLYGHGP